MHLFSQFTLGIDIQHDSAAVVCMQSSAKGHKLVGHEVFALDPSFALAEKINQLGTLVKKFLEEHKVYEPDVLVSVPGNKIIIREISFPLSVKENLQETMRYEVEKYVPFSASDIYFDCQITSIDKRTNKLNVLLVVSKKEDLDPYFALQTEIGAMSSLESSATILAFGVDAEHCAKWQDGVGFLLSMEEDRLLCNLFKGQHLLVSHPLHPGENRQQQNKMLGEALESLCSAREKTLSEETIYYLDEGSSPQFADYSGGSLALTPLPLPEMLPAANLLIAYFLALKGQRQPVGLTNLLPVNIRRRPTRTSMYVTITLSAIILLLSLGLTGNFFLQKGMLNRQLTAEMTRLSSEVKGLPDLQDDISSIKSRIEYLAGAGQQKTIMLDIINELSLLLPSSAWIEKFDFSKKYVRIDGSAESATALIERFELSALFKDVSFLTPVRKGKDGKEKFSIGLSVNETEQ